MCEHWVRAIFWGGGWGEKKGGQFHAVVEGQHQVPLDPGKPVRHAHTCKRGIEGFFFFQCMCVFPCVARLYVNVVNSHILPRAPLSLLHSPIYIYIIVCGLCTVELGYRRLVCTSSTK